MNSIKDRKIKSFNYTSRYSTTPYYYHKLDDKYFYGLGTQLHKDSIYVSHKVKKEDNLDALALKYYGNPSFWWIIADFNSITDPFIKLYEHFKVIKIPSFNSIEFGNER